MGFYAPVLEMLDKVIDSYREEFHEANKAVGGNGFLDNYDMNHLLKSNNKAQAALKIRAIISSVNEEDKANVAHIAGLWMNDAIKAGNYSVAHLYENVIKELSKLNP